MKVATKYDEQVLFLTTSPTLSVMVQREVLPQELERPEPFTLDILSNGRTVETYLLFFRREGWEGKTVRSFLEAGLMVQADEYLTPDAFTRRLLAWGMPEEELSSLLHLTGWAVFLIYSGDEIQFQFYRPEAKEVKA